MAVRALLLRGYPERLKYTEQDVNLVRQTFDGLNITTEILEGCSKFEVLETVEKVCSEVYRNDTLIIYYTGHGELNAGALELVFPQDGNTDYSTVQASWICDVLAKFKVGKALLILDCCHAQKVTSHITSNKQNKIHVFCSSGITEKSWEIDEYKQSAFTKFMCDAMNALAKELEPGRHLNLRDLDERTRTLIRAHNQSQNRDIPLCSAHGVGINETVLFTAAASNNSDTFRKEAPEAVPETKYIVRPFVDKLLPPLSTHCFGRTRILDCLEKWIDESISVLCLHGPAGIGKSALIFHYLSRIVNRQPAQKDVFYWSFDCYDPKGTPASDLSAFFESALSYYGCTSDVRGRDDLTKAAILCEKIKSRRTILVLDDFQVFQSHTSIDNNIVDKAMRTFITNLAWDGLHNGGLVILLSTLRVNELDNYRNAGNHELLPLSIPDCLKLFKEEGIIGSQEKFERTANYFNRNPLMLTLLARLLRTKFNRRLSSLDNISLLTELHGKETMDGQALDRVTAYYTSLWPVGSDENTLLMLFSLLRNPFKVSLLTSLLQQKEAMPELVFLTDINRCFAILEVLERTGLLICTDGNTDSTANKKNYTIQSIVRDYYLDSFKANKPVLFCIVNQTLGEYMRNTFDDRTADSVKDMEPLYDAIYYLTNAQQYAEALDIVWYQLCRERNFFSQKVLGAYSNDLHAISRFFTNTDSWKPVSMLPDVDAAWVCSLASYLLNTMGYLHKAEMTRRSAIIADAKIGHKLMLASDQQHLGRNLFLQAKLLEAEEQFQNVLRIVNEELNIDATITKSRYLSEINPDHIRMYTLIRYAFLHYLQGKTHYEEALRLISQIPENYNFTGTNAAYHCLIMHACCKDQKQMDALHVRIQQYPSQATNAGRPHEIAYAHLLRAYHATDMLRNTISPLLKDQMESILQDIGQALQYAKNVDRMDQYPFVLLIVSQIYLVMYRKVSYPTVKYTLDNNIRNNFKELENTLKNRDIPLYEIELEFLRLEWAIMLGNREEAKELYHQMRKRPETLANFKDRLEAAYNLIQ